MTKDTSFTILMTAIIIMAVGVLILIARHIDAQVSDNRKSPTVYVDQGTGCHYLGTGSSTLVPRMNANGEHMCLSVVRMP